MSVEIAKNKQEADFVFLSCFYCGCSILAGLEKTNHIVQSTADLPEMLHVDADSLVQSPYIQWYS